VHRLILYMWLKRREFIEVGKPRSYTFMLNAHCFVCISGLACFSEDSVSFLLATFRFVLLPLKFSSPCFRAARILCVSLVG